MFKRKQTKTANKTYYWFRLQSGSNILMTSEMYSTKQMRDAGIEASKAAVLKEVGITMKGFKRVKRKPSDTFHIENAEGKIVKR